MSQIVVQLVYAELLRVLGLIGPEHFNVTCHAVVLLVLFKPKDIIIPKIEHSLRPSLVLALVGNKLFLDSLHKLLLGGLPDLSPPYWWTGNP